MIKIIADIGGNIENDLDKGKRLILKAKEAGADKVKLQLYRESDLYLDGSNQQKLDYDKCAKLFEFAKEIGIDIFSSVFSTEAINFLVDLGCREFKFAAFEANRIDLWNQFFIFAGEEFTIHFSTGLLNADDLNMIKDNMPCNHRIIPYHSISNYEESLEPEDLNLGRIRMLKQYFNTCVGFSDHLAYYETPITGIAIALGAEYIEKHLRFNYDSPEIFALLPDQFKDYVTALKEFESMLGTGITENQLTKLKCKEYFRKDGSSVYSRGYAKME